MIIRIRPLLDLRQQHSDQTLLDYLTLVTMASASTPGRVATNELRTHWGCSQPMVSRRLAAVARAGLASIRPGYGVYLVRPVGAAR